VITKSGQERMIAFRNTVIRDEAGEVSGILFSGEDITEQLQVEEQLRQAAKMESVGRLAGGWSRTRAPGRS
jgi:signal transduction histidine kinase